MLANRTLAVETSYICKCQNLISDWFLSMAYLLSPFPEFAEGKTSSTSLDKLKLECEEIKNMLPMRTSSESSDAKARHHSDDLLNDLESDEEEEEVGVSAMLSPRSEKLGSQNAGLSLEDLDLLPTREQPNVESHIGLCACFGS